MKLARFPSGRLLALILSAQCLAATTTPACASPQPASATVVRAALEKQPNARDLTHYNLGKERLALQGYDPVAYFPEGGGKPRKGEATITTTYEGVLYRFAGEETKKLFLASPARFEPQYGGWCAYAMADGDKIEIDPESFLVTDGKLYLFFKAWYADTRAKWKKDPEGLRKKADEAWKKLLE